MQPAVQNDLWYSLLGRVLINRGSADQGASDVRYAPDSGAKVGIAGLPRSATSGHSLLEGSIKAVRVMSKPLVPYDKVAVFNKFRDAYTMPIAIRPRMDLEKRLE